MAWDGQKLAPKNQTRGVGKNEKRSFVFCELGATKNKKQDIRNKKCEENTIKIKKSSKNIKKLKQQTVD